MDRRRQGGAGSASGELGRAESGARRICRADKQRWITGKPHAVGEALQIERDHLLRLPAEGFELAETPIFRKHFVSIARERRPLTMLCCWLCGPSCGTKGHGC